MKKALCSVLFFMLCAFLVLSGCSAPGGGAPTVKVDNSKFFTGYGVPPSSTGVDGDLYLDETNLILYVKTSGAWATVASLRGPQGAQGGQGAQGAQGAGWLVGSGAPTGTFGNVGDLYLDTTNMIGYQKQSGGWAVLFSFAPDTPWFVGQTPESAPTNPHVGDLYLDLLSTMVYKWSGSAWTPIAAFQVAIPQYVFTPNFIGYMKGIAYGNSKFVAVGDAGTIVYSTDGTNWDYPVSINTGTAGRFGSITSGGAGSATVARQMTAAQLANHQRAVQCRTAFNRKGAVYQGIYGGGGTADLQWYLSSVAYGGGWFVAVGWDTTNGYGVMLTSTDGSNWAFQAYTYDESYPCYLNSVAYVNGQFIVSGSYLESGIMIIGTPGGTWNAVPLSCNALYAAVSDGADTLVVGGDYTLGSYSYSGTTWSSPMYPTGHYGTHYSYIYGVAYGAGKFVAVGNSGSTTSILTSGEPVSTTSWTTQDLPLSYRVNLNAIIYGPSGFIAVGNDGTVLTSPDGVSWAMQNWFSLFYGEGAMTNTSDFAGVTWGVMGGKVLYAIAQSDASQL